MSITVSSSANYLGRTTDLPGADKFTFMCWVRFDSLSVTEPIFARSQASGQAFFLFKNSTNVFAHRIGSSSAALGSASISAGTWYHIALTRDTDPATNEHDIYVDGVKDIDNDVNNTWDEDEMQLGRNKRFSAQMNGEIAAVKLWDGVVLTQAQIVQEMWQYLPIHQLGSLHIWSPFVDQDDTQFIDYSGNGRNWTENGTITIDDGPPIAWAANMVRPLIIAAGGTTFNISPSGSVTPSGVLIKQTNKDIGGSITFSGVMVKSVQKLLSGNLSPSGALATAKTAVLSLAGSLTPSGTIVKNTQKTTVGSITPTGQFAKTVQKVFNGTITPSGVLEAVKTALLSLAGSLTPSGSLAKQTSKALAGSSTPTGELSKQTNKVFGGSITPSGVVAAIKTALLSVSGSITPSGSLTKQVNKMLAGTVTAVGSLTRSVQKLLSGQITPSGALTAVKTVLLSLAGSIAPEGSVTRQIIKSFSGQVTMSGQVVKTIFKSFAGSITASGVVSVVNTAVSVTVVKFKGMWRGMMKGMSR